MNRRGADRHLNLAVNNLVGQVGIGDGRAGVKLGAEVYDPPSVAAGGLNAMVYLFALPGFNEPS